MYKVTYISMTYKCFSPEVAQYMLLLKHTLE